MPKYPARTYEDIEKEKAPYEYLRNKLKLKHLEAQGSFREKFPEAHKFFVDRGVDLGKIREHSAKILGTSVLTGSLLFTPANISIDTGDAQRIVEELRLDKLSQNSPQDNSLPTLLGQVLPSKVRPLERSEEKTLEKIFDDNLHIKTKANLEGEHLNTTYGLIGAEQHLKRFPGDSINQHGSGQILKEGIAPGLGAWGYFAYSKNGLTPELENIEKWYAVVQTLYLPDWARRQPYLRDWYKYRKVLVVNTVNGKAVVAAIADSGPAAWTGKHFGGSPEVMDYLGGPRYKKGPVIIFFVDDPENKVQLGPVEYEGGNLASK